MQIIIALAILVSLIATWITAAAAHQAPSGWEYPPGCCSGKLNECHPEPIIETTKGYLISRLSIVVPYGDARIKPSGDNETHICEDSGGVHCVYLPLSS